MEKVPIEKLREIEDRLGCTFQSAASSYLHEVIKELEAYRAADKPEPPANTVRVRIPVAVDENGGWVSSDACHFFTRDDVFRVIASKASVYLPVPSTIIWVEADLPIPKPRTVDGTVSRE